MTDFAIRLGGGAEYYVAEEVKQGGGILQINSALGFHIFPGSNPQRWMLTLEGRFSYLFPPTVQQKLETLGGIGVWFNSAIKDRRGGGFGYSTTLFAGPEFNLNRSSETPPVKIVLDHKFLLPMPLPRMGFYLSPQAGFHIPTASPTSVKALDPQSVPENIKIKPFIAVGLGLHCACFPFVD